MKPKVLIKDLLDELSDENQRLFDELTICQQFQQLFDNYRQLFSNFIINCLCIENNTFRQQLNELEVQYMSLKNKMKKKSLSKKISATIDNHKNNEDMTSDDNNKLLTKQRYKKSAVNSRIKRQVVVAVKTTDTITADDDNNSDMNERVLSEANDITTTDDITSGGSKKIKNFICDYNGCDKRFRQRDHLLQHYRVKHTNERPFVCQDCDKGFPTAQTLKNHMTTKHPSIGKEFRCSIIGCSFRTQVLQKLYDHNQSHKPKNGTKRVRKLMANKFVCDWIGCSKQYSQKRNLETHIRSQHTKDRPFSCQNCDKLFASQEILRQHVAAIHTDGGEPKFICQHVGCDYKSRTSAALYQHKLQHRPKLVKPKIVSAKHKKQLKFVCEVVGCQKRFQCREHRLAHFRNRHTNERPFKCDECGAQFAIERYLDFHRSKIHTDAPVVRCKYDGCPYETRVDSRLAIHYLRHEDVRKFECQSVGCGKRFVTKRLLGMHAKLHTEERPFPCSWPGCDKQFRNNFQLKMHLERHSGVRAYRCPLPDCDKSYTTQKGLEQHSRAHTMPYQCSWPACEARYQNSIKLKDHMNGHQGIKPFSCHFQGCDVSYSSRDSLRMHWRQTHKYIKTYHDKT